MNPQYSEDDQLTTRHVRLAVGGDTESITWVATRFSPWLLVQARYRLGKQLRRVCDPEDLVNDVWVVALPKLDRIVPRNDRFTPVLLCYLSRILLNRLGDLMKRDLHRQKEKSEPDAHSTAGRFLENLPEETAGIVTRVVNQERRDAVTACLDRLRPQEREIIVLRGIEQNSTMVVAAMLGLEETAVRVRYHRALQRLRTELDDTYASLLPDE